MDDKVKNLITSVIDSEFMKRGMRADRIAEAILKSLESKGYLILPKAAGKLLQTLESATVAKFDQVHIDGQKWVREK